MRREVGLGERRQAPRREDDLDLAEARRVRGEVARVDDVRVQVGQRGDPFAPPAAVDVAVAGRVIVEERRARPHVVARETSMK